jgi:hypothetical protein
VLIRSNIWVECLTPTMRAGDISRHQRRLSARRYRCNIAQYCAEPREELLVPSVDVDDPLSDAPLLQQTRRYWFDHFNVANAWCAAGRCATTATFLVAILHTGRGSDPRVQLPKQIQRPISAACTFSCPVRSMWWVGGGNSRGRVRTWHKCSSHRETLSALLPSRALLRGAMSAPARRSPRSPNSGEGIYQLANSSLRPRSTKVGRHSG